MTTLSRAIGAAAIICAAFAASAVNAQVLIDADKPGDSAHEKFIAEQQELREEMILESYYSVLGSPDDLPRETERIIYGSDDRRDVYELLPSETDLQFYQQAAAIVMNDSSVINNGNGTYDLVTSPWTSASSCGTLCASEPFRGQLDLGWCSAFLVGPDILVTAGHCVDSGDCGSVAFVFGFDQLGPSTDPLTTVPADDVYFCQSIINHSLGGGLDHSVIRLDRPVVGYTPLPIRRTGVIANNDPLVMIGHPQGIPKKIDDGGVCKNNQGSTPWFYANLDAYGGNSGSMVINLNTGVIEGILVRGNTDFTTSGGCCISNTCADTGCPDWEECSKTISFASFVPELGLSVTPAATTIHDGPTGGPFTNNSVAYTLDNPTSNPISYQVSLVAGGTDFLLIDGGTAPLSGTVPASSSVIVTASLAASATGLAQGIYSKDILFEDLTNSLNHTRSHSLEVNQTGISVTPSSDYLSGGPLGGPFTGTTTYTVTSTKSTPVNVSVSSAQSWINLNGSASPQNFTLTGTGDFLDIVVTFNSGADALPNGLHTSTLSFNNTSGGIGSSSRDILLDVGRFTYGSTDTPIAIPDDTSSGITSIINVPDNITVADVDVEVDITHTYKGDLIVRLTSPGGTAVTLHDRSGGSTDDIVETYDDDGGGIPAEGPGALANFENELAQGDWTLFVSDNAGIDTGSLNSWTLKIASLFTGPDPLTIAVAAPPALIPPNTPTTFDVTIDLGDDTLVGGSPTLHYRYDGGAYLQSSLTFISGNTWQASLPSALCADTPEYYVSAEGSDTGVVTAPATAPASTFATAVGVVVTSADLDFETDPSWTLSGSPVSGAWERAVPGNFGLADPPADSDGSGQCYVTGNTSGETLQGTTVLTTPAYDASGGGSMSYDYWVNVQGVMPGNSSGNDTLTVEYATDAGGTNWTALRTHNTVHFQWNTEVVSIGPGGDIPSTATLRLRFTGAESQFPTPFEAGIDNFVISAGVECNDSGCDGDANGDNIVDVNDISYVLFRLGNSGTPGSVDGDANADGIVDVNDISYVLFRLGPC